MKTRERKEPRNEEIEKREREKKTFLAVPSMSFRAGGRDHRRRLLASKIFLSSEVSDGVVTSW